MPESGQGKRAGDILDDTEVGSGSWIPLWMFGFLY